MIPKEAFSGCTSLTKVIIPDGVIRICDYAFNDCISLKSIVIPESVKYIGSKAFGYYYDEFDTEHKTLNDFVIYGVRGTASETYAKNNEINFIEFAFAFGDVNGDGKINIDDVTDIQKYIANMIDFTEEQVTLADVDKNGKVSIDDATLIQKHLAGMDVIE